MAIQNARGVGKLAAVEPGIAQHQDNVVDQAIGTGAVNIPSVPTHLTKQQTANRTSGSALSCISGDTTDDRSFARITGDSAYHDALGRTTQGVFSDIPFLSAGPSTQSPSASQATVWVTAQRMVVLASNSAAFKPVAAPNSARDQKSC